MRARLAEGFFSVGNLRTSPKEANTHKLVTLFRRSVTYVFRPLPGVHIIANRTSPFLPLGAPATARMILRHFSGGKYTHHRLEAHH